jgi:Cu+-exporting ATPase
MTKDSCYHCGDSIIGKAISFDQHDFCCNGCKSVYQLLNDNQLGSFYTLEAKGGSKPSESNQHKYAFLEVESIRNKFIAFEDENSAKIVLFLPQIHCSSCIYLLENLAKLLPAVYSCQVNFAKREASITFDPAQLSLAELALFLDKIGYAPNFGNRNQTEKKLDKLFMYKLGIAGFAFGSIMLWSFPEYLGIDDTDANVRNFTAFLSLGISIPVLFFSASDYFISAFKALRFKSLNLDVPITIGIIALYLQSFFSIINAEGPGYMDSFAGFIFFLLIGKWFQNKTYKSLSFERDYTSYFPVAVTRLTDSKEEIIEIEALKIGDVILIRNEEIIPCDATMLSLDAKIDYSFVTGEATLITKKEGDFIYAGGKLSGKAIQLQVLKESNRSHLTQLWNDVISEKEVATTFKVQDKLSIYFLVIILIISGIAALAWSFIDLQRVTQIVVSILIVACPCALALSAPFTFGNTMRALGRKGLYLKNTRVVEQLNEITDIVFDKTGTLTSSSFQSIEYSGDSLSSEELSMIVVLANSSTHPLSRGIVKQYQATSTAELELLHFEESQGKGISGSINHRMVKIGNGVFTGQKEIEKNETSTYISIDNTIFGRFIFTSQIRTGIELLLRSLPEYNLHLLSGDTEKDKQLFTELFPENSTLLFEQTPQNKLNFIQQLKAKGNRVLMIGDGLNDAGALGIADVGIAVSEDVFRFTPSSDAIIEASKLGELNRLISISKFAKTILTTCLIFSLAYNVVGLSIAISGNLTPLVAAILMPISSITIVLITTFMMRFKAN